MKRRPFRTIALLACLVNVPLAVTADEALSARIEVLVELADEGVVDAYYELADIAQANPESSHFRGDKGLQYLAISAATGRGSAVRWLAYRLLKTNNSLDEAATLIAMAALMGDQRAAIDLRLWPKLTQANRDLVVEGFTKAVERLAGGQIIDCDALPFDCASGMERVRSLAAGDVLMARALRERGPFTDIDSVHAIFQTTYDAYVAFPGRRYRQFRLEQQQHNSQMQQLTSDAPESLPNDLQTEWEQRAYLDRQQARADASRRYLDATLEADIQRYLESLEEAVERINRHRAPADRVDAAALIDAIQSASRK